MIVLDTNIVSELLRPASAPQVIDWLRRQPSTSLFVTSITHAEILYGIAILDGGRRRDELHALATAILIEDYAGQTLGFDEEAASFFAIIAAERRRLGKPISQADAQIAAITRSRGAMLATRNVRDFVDCGIALVNPWDDN
ncbi:type II toxin-antitoxin system VapC family toxin [Rhizorhapis sp. SPR117]|uniref:type II toxin-antitoxin system VapC family toxin n=1 Tax=Rhizorhapis sp. SPR117 TaxID=2912611 RepID=UPI001F248DA0|nr:type II toxin-antitoxin system VapC family toxin [Rhizorhapis sp. SPR117]